MVSVNTAPGRSGRKPPWALWKIRCHYCKHSRFARITGYLCRSRTVSICSLLFLYVSQQELRFFFFSSSANLIWMFAHELPASALIPPHYYKKPFLNQLTPSLIYITIMAKKVSFTGPPRCLYPISSISCYCWQLSWSPTIDPSPWEKIRWGNRDGFHIYYLMELLLPERAMDFLPLKLWKCVSVQGLFCVCQYMSVLSQSG